ncbi:hypothetical protein BpHYR1_003197 [Brachionus plicatilis]|uniref:Uncharacterized protein n=1 Tax=Brachionus plicatilis TaxID=10195 RepID=A0A3M7R002_BRAPC|nr:hypothetical protein BpHYR1_003197 [Brachionus plicatilis]
MEEFFYFRKIELKITGIKTIHFRRALARFTCLVLDVPKVKPLVLDHRLITVVRSWNATQSLWRK